VDGRRSRCTVTTGVCVAGVGMTRFGKHVGGDVAALVVTILQR
jgi:hypothetical protein